MEEVSIEMQLYDGQDLRGRDDRKLQLGLMA